MPCRFVDMEIRRLPVLNITGELPFRDVLVRSCRLKRSNKLQRAWMCQVHLEDGIDDDGFVHSRCPIADENWSACRWYEPE